MRQKKFVPIILIVAFLLGACQALPDLDDLEYGLNDTIARKIVWESLDRLELVLNQYYDETLLDENKDIINENLIDEKKNTAEQEKFLKPYRGAFRALLAEEQLEPLMRKIIYEYYGSMQTDYLSNQHMDIRFELVDQEEEAFTASFIQLADGEHFEHPRKFTVTYTKEHQEWLLDDYTVEEIDNPKLDLTIEDIKEYYHYQHNSQAEMIDSTEEYYIFRIKEKDVKEPESYVVAIHRDTSLENPELAQQYE